MKSFTTTEFWEAYSLLPDRVKQLARKSYQLWRKDHFYPSLHFKKVGGVLWSACITRDYRSLALKKGENYYWIWIGTHDEYESLIKGNKLR